MEYNRNHCCKHIIWRLCDIISKDAIKCDVKSREFYLNLSKGLHTGYFKYGRRRLLADLDMNQEHEYMREQIEMALDQILGPARQKSMTKLIITSLMETIIEIPLKQADLEYAVKYYKNSADVRVKIGDLRWLEANLKYKKNLNDAVDKLIAAAVAMKDLCYMTDTIGLPIL